MKKIFAVISLVVFFVCNLTAQINLPNLKLTESYSNLKSLNSYQPKTRKATNTYFGAGYSFVIFTESDMNSTYPVFDTRQGDFLSEINLYFGFAIAKAVTLEIEPSILFTHNDRIPVFQFDPPIRYGNNDYPFAFSNNIGLLAFPIALNARFFPMYKQTTSFIRLFFIGGGIGTAWIREEYDNYYSFDDPRINGYYYNDAEFGATTSQWRPLFRVMTGFTGTGGQFGFGGELRYNIIPLKQEQIPFVTRTSPNFNSVDITLRFYFSL
jgi:hypothetical protein